MKKIRVAGLCIAVLLLVLGLAPIAYSAGCTAPVDFCLDIGSTNFTNGEVRTATLTIYNTTSLDTGIFISYSTNVNVSQSTPFYVAKANFTLSTPPAFKGYQRKWNITALSGGVFDINVSTNITWQEPNISLSSYVQGAITSISSIAAPSSMYPLVENAFLVNITLSNTGSSADTDFTVSLSYNGTELFVNGASICQSGSCVPNTLSSSMEGALNKTSITFNASLGASSASIVAFNVSALNKGAIYTQGVNARARNEFSQKSLVIQEGPRYGLNITRVYNASSGMLSISSSNATIQFPFQVDNTGNVDLFGVSINASLNSTPIGATSSGITRSNYTLPSYSANFETLGLRPGVYNLSSFASHSLASDEESRMIEISFTFNDTDNDTYYPLANGGTDCNDNSNSVHPGATETLNSVDDDCDGSSDEGLSTDSGNSGSSSSAGGGGGAGAAPDTTEKPAESAPQEDKKMEQKGQGESFQSFTDIEANVPVTMIIYDERIAITRNMFILNKEIKDASISIDETIPSVPYEGEVFQYLEIVIEGISDDDISEATLEFKVPIEWLMENSIEEDEVALLRYSGGWQDLSTKKTGKSTTHVLYRAITPGFSTFAIAAKKAEEKPEAAPIAKDRKSAFSAITAAVLGGASGNGGLIALAIVVVLAIAGFFIRPKKKKQRKRQ